MSQKPLSVTWDATTRFPGEEVLADNVVLECTTFILMSGNGMMASQLMQTSYEQKNGISVATAKERLIGWGIENPVIESCNFEERYAEGLGVKKTVQNPEFFTFGKDTIGIGEP